MKAEIYEYENMVNAYKIATGEISMDSLEGVENERTFDYFSWYLGGTTTDLSQLTAYHLQQLRDSSIFSAWNKGISGVDKQFNGQYIAYAETGLFCMIPVR